MSNLIHCPKCGDDSSWVKDSRSSGTANEIRRRRVCANGHKFSTYEIIEEDMLHARAIKGYLTQIAGAVSDLKKQFNRGRAVPAFTSPPGGRRIADTTES